MKNLGQQIEVGRKILKESIQNKTLREYLIEQGIENPPEVELDFFFHEHGTKEDAEKVLKKLTDYDVLAMEFAGWDQDMEFYINNISKYGLSKNEIQQISNNNKMSEFGKNILLGISSSQKRVIFPDIGINSTSFKEFKSLVTLGGTGDDFNFGFPKKDISFQENSIGYFNLLKKVIELQIQREKEIIANLPSVLSILLKKDSELQRKEKIGVLIPFGAVHTSLHKMTHDLGIKITRSFPDANYTYRLLDSFIKLTLHKGIEEVDKYDPQFFMIYLLLLKLGVNPKSISVESLKSISLIEAEELFNCFKNSDSMEGFQNLVKKSEILMENEQFSKAFE